ncbi:unnamed protein product [Durusdinium trenchii]|uniref:Peptidase C14 caspase domain-containing protein n=1 Tax=Durusdinium trenchii TaxID=1381693 RepID=A0ABP0KSN6_9DINO
MIAMAWVTLCLLLPAAIAKSFPYPDSFDHVVACDTCNGTGARDCSSSDCQSRCPSEGKQCFKSNRYKLGCCCDPAKMPSPNIYKCRRGAKKSGPNQCLSECCQAVTYAEKKTWATICGDGCCKPSNHGTQNQCGSSWPLGLKGGKLKRHPCCLLKGASQDHQNGARCCFHGDGVNCSSPKQEPCCLLASTTTTHKNQSTDPHAVCQRKTCAAYIPCQASRGVNCESRSKTVCCLKATQPSISDPCQISVEDCNSRYMACNAGDQLGIDCSSRLTDPLRASLLLPGARVSLAPVIEHPRRILLAISCQGYQNGYGVLETPHGDADLLAGACESMGYEVIKIQGSSHGAIFEGFRRAVHLVSGTTNALLLVSFSGHAVEINGKMMWAPEDAVRGDMNTHFNVASVCRDLMEVHLNDGAERFGAMQPAKSLFVVLLADCCREPGGSHCEPFQEARHGRRRRDRPSLYIIYACGPGLLAADAAPDGSHSPFMHHVVEQIQSERRVSCFAAVVNEELKKTTNYRQEVWHPEGTGNFDGVTLSVPGRLRSGSGSSMLTENSQPEVVPSRQP